jgi:hypothetical protein
VQLADDAAVGEEDRPVRVRRGHGIVGDHHGGLAELADGLPHERQDLGARARVEVAGGLVGEDDLGPARQRPRDGDALLLTTRELRRPVPEARAEPDDGDDLVEPSAVGPVTGEAHGQEDVLPRGERRDEVELLEHEPHPVAAQPGELALVEAPEVGVPDPDVSGRQGVEAGHHVQKGRLARARRAHDRGEATGLELDGDAVEGADLGLASAVYLDRVDGAGRGRVDRLGRDDEPTGVARSARRRLVDVVDGRGHVVLLLLRPAGHPRRRRRCAGSSAACGNRRRESSASGRVRPDGRRIRDAGREGPRTSRDVCAGRSRGRCRQRHGSVR